MRGWLPSESATVFEKVTSKHVRIRWYLLAIAVLGVLVYAPVIQNPGIMPPPVQGICYGCPLMVPPQVNSLTMQFLGFGASYLQYQSLGNNFGNSLQFCLGVPDCSNSPFGLSLLGDLLLVIAVISVSLAIRFLYSRKGILGASSQLSLGIFAILFPIVLILLGIPPVWLSFLAAKEMVVAGSVLVLTAIAEIWWFRLKESQLANEPLHARIME